MIEAALSESYGQVSGPSGAATKLGQPAKTLDSKLKNIITGDFLANSRDLPFSTGLGQRVVFDSNVRLR